MTVPISDVTPETRASIVRLRGGVKVRLSYLTNQPYRSFTMKRTIIAAALLATGILSAAPSYALTKGDLIGEPGASDSFNRTIHVTPGTRSINVDEAETVNLDINGQTTTWKFDGVKPVVNLQEIVPGAPSVNVYVEPSDRFEPNSAP
jgi:hypothetical protein